MARLLAVALCWPGRERVGVGVFLGLLVEVVGDDFPIVMELFAHWSGEGLSKL